MAVIVRLIKPEEGSLLNRVAPDVFDHEVHPQWAAEFLADSRHHLAIALDDNLVVGMASAVHYVHPDKAPELWINEVGVAPSHQQQGIGRQLLQCLLDHGHHLGCATAWVLTEQGNQAARRLYASVGGIEAAEPIVMIEFGSPKT